MMRFCPSAVARLALAAFMASAVPAFSAPTDALLLIVTNRAEYPYELAFRFTMPGMTSITGVNLSGYAFSTNSVLIDRIIVSGSSFTLEARIFETEEFTLPEMTVLGFENEIPRERTVFPRRISLSNFRKPPDSLATPSPIEDVFPMNDPFPFLLTAGLLAAAVAAWFFYFKILPALRRSGRPHPGRDPYEEALSELTRLRKSRDPVKHDREIHLRVWEILRKFLQGVFGFAAREMATSEIRAALGQASVAGRKPPENILGATIQALRLCDRVKYAKFRPERESTEQLLANAFEIVIQTKTHYSVPDTDPGTKAGLP